MRWHVNFSKSPDDIIVTAISKSPTLVVKDPPIVEEEEEETGIERDEGGIDKEDRPELPLPTTFTTHYTRHGTN